MIDYIIRPNPRIDQELLFESIHWYNVQQNKPIFLRIVDVNTKETVFKQTYELILYFEIRTSNFKCKAYDYHNGKADKTKTIIINATNETVKAKYLIKGHDWKFKIEKYEPIFNLVNYALQQRNAVFPGNRQGLNNIDPLLLESALRGLDFKAVIYKDDKGQLILEARPKDDTKVNYTE